MNRSNATPLLTPRSLLLGLLLLCGASDLAAQYADLCAVPTGTNRLANSVVIDANTGQILEGTTRFLDGDRVQVIIRNKNPFKYAYRFSTSSAPLESQILSDFLGALYPGVSAVLGRLNDTKVFYDTLGKSAKPLGGEKTCYESTIEKIEPEMNVVTLEMNRLRESLEEHVKKYDDFLRKTDGDRIICEQRVQDAQYLLPVLDELRSMSRFTTDLNNLRYRINRLDDLFKQLIGIVPPGPGSKECRDALDRSRGLLATRLNSDAGAISEALTQLKNEKQKFEDLTSIIHTTLGSGNAFVDVLYPQAMTGGPTNVQVTMYRRSLREKKAPETQVGSVNLQIGETRMFSISAGVGFSTMEEVSYVRQKGIVADTVGTIFGYEHNSTFIPSPVLMVSGHLFRVSVFGEKDLSFGLSLGGVLDIEDLDVQYLAGLTLGELNDQLLLTFAYHAARQDTLVGGFRVGDPIPANLSDPLPIERNWRPAFMFAMTYKIR